MIQALVAGKDGIDFGDGIVYGKGVSIGCPTGGQNAWSTSGGKNAGEIQNPPKIHKTQLVVSQNMQNPPGVTRGDRYVKNPPGGQNTWTPPGGQEQIDRLQPGPQPGHQF